MDLNYSLSSAVTIFSASATAVALIGGILVWKQIGQKKSQQVQKMNYLKAWKKIKLPLKERVFVVYNKENKFLKLKKNEKLCFKTVFDDCNVKFSFPDAEDLIVKMPEDTVIIKFKMSDGDTLDTVDCGDEAAEWFSKILIDQPSGLRLGCFVQALVPPRSAQPAFNKFDDANTKLQSEARKFCKEQGLFCDTARDMMMSDLNWRDSEVPVSEHNFQPNIMVKDPPAFDKDSWVWKNIGNQVMMRTSKYCSRCINTSMNPGTAASNSSTERSKTQKKRIPTESEKKVLERFEPLMREYYDFLFQFGVVHAGDPVHIA